MKKAQTETIGLVIIVSLLAFILIFVLQILNKPVDNSLNDHYLQLNADNLRSVILKTNVCKDVSIKDELISCNSGNPECPILNNDCNNLKNIIKPIIENSLNINRNYKFSAGTIIVQKGNCKNFYTAASEPIPYSSLNISLGIC